MNPEKINSSQTKESKVRLIAYWIFTGLIALETAAGAQWDLTRNDFVKQVMIHLGYPQYILTILGIWKIPAFIALVIPKFPLVKEWAYAGLFFVYTGATASHIAIGDKFGAWFTTLVLTAFTVASWALRPKSRKIQPV